MSVFVQFQTVCLANLSVSQALMQKKKKKKNHINHIFNIIRDLYFVCTSIFVFILLKQMNPF